MPFSEIDDIFASKDVRKATQPTASLDPPERNKRDAKSDANLKSKDTKKRPAPETVVDPSAPPPSIKKVKVRRGFASNSGLEAERQSKGKADEGSFKDSRGSTSRRKTEDGLSIYKAHELGIGDEGGDTPLCPFDCQCCF